MSSGTTSAWIAASAAVIAVFLTQFVAESYRRFKDGSAIAAGLAGELSSYKEAGNMIDEMLKNAQKIVAAGDKDILSLRPFERPVDRYFDKVVEKLGLLGPDLTEQVIYVYNNLDAFRMAFEIITKQHLEMTSFELSTRLTACDDAFQRAKNSGLTLVPALHERSKKYFVAQTFNR